MNRATLKAKNTAKNRQETKQREKKRCVRCTQYNTELFDALTMHGCHHGHITTLIAKTANSQSAASGLAADVNA